MLLSFCRRPLEGPKLITRHLRFSPGFLLLIGLPLLLLEPVAKADAAAPSTSSPALNPTSLGSTHEAEAQFLWTEGLELFESADYQEATRVLKRLVDRYPAHPKNLQALALLGQSYLYAGHVEKAIAPLRTVVEASPPKNEAALSARIHLAQAYLAAKKPEQAMLTLFEVLELTKGRAASDATILRAALVKARAELSLQKAEQARATLDSVLKQIPELETSLPTTPPIKTEAAEVELDWRLAQCQSLKGRGRQTEAQIINSIEKQGTCLQEGLLIWNQIQIAARKADFERATQKITRTYREFFQDCLRIPPPAQPLSGIQLRKYQAELRIRTRQLCTEHFRSSLELASRFSETDQQESVKGGRPSPIPSGAGGQPPKQSKSGAGTRVDALKKSLQLEYQRHLEKPL